MVYSTIMFLAAAVYPAFAETSIRDEDQALGKRFAIAPDSLPKPKPEQAVSNPPVLVERGSRQPNVPEGFAVTLFAEKLDHPRQLLVLANGDVLLAEQQANHVLLLRDADNDGHAEFVQLFASGFKQPYGLAYRDGEVLVADQDGIWTVKYREGEVRADAGYKPKSAAELPEEERGPKQPMDHQPLTAKGVFGGPGGHGTRSLAIDPKDGTLHVGVGSTGNLGEEPLPRASIQAFDHDGSKQRTVASGMRNPVGVNFHPETGELWTVVQERDGLGDKLVPDYMTRVQQGGFYGWPYAYIGQNPQPGFAERAPEKVRQTIVPDLLFEAHSSTMDFAFYAGDQFPEEYRGDAFVALKGSWNRTEPSGYKVVRVKFENGKPAGWYENFITGFWVGGEKKAEVWGRPADVAVAKDGSLLIADDTGGTIWRVSHQGEAQEAQKSSQREPEPSEPAKPGG
jgi:glucose/arabinose dehydrogenase